MGAFILNLQAKIQTLQRNIFCYKVFYIVPCFIIVFKEIGSKNLYTGGAEAGERADAAEEQEQGAPGRAGEPPQCP